MYFPYSYYPNTFSRELPPLLDIAFQILGVTMPMEQLWFYWTHWTMHQSQWLYDNIHYVHHEMKAPIAPAAFSGMHCVVFWIGAPFGLFSTMNSHSGWALPFLSSPANHD